LNLHQPDPARGRIVAEGSPDFDFWIGREQSPGPTVAQVTQARDLAISADRTVKCECRDDGVVIGGRMRADESRVGGSYFVRKRVGGVRGDYAATTYPRPRSAACGNTNP
jgi:hypothetical protein